MIPLALSLSFELYASLRIVIYIKETCLRYGSFLSGQYDLLYNMINV